MPVERLAVSFAQPLAREVRAEAEGESVSAWLADAAARKVRRAAARAALADYEAEHGEITAEETSAVRARWPA